MGTANEAIVYAGAMIVSIILLTVATTFTSAMLDSAYGLMELNHERYQSVQATYLLVDEDQNYNMTRNQFWNRVDMRSSNDQCRYVYMPKKYTYLGDTPDLLNTTEMNITSRGTIADCQIEDNPHTGQGQVGTVPDSGSEIINMTYPALATAMNNPGSNPGRWELIRTFPYN